MPLSCAMLPSALGQHYTTLGHNFSVLTSARPVNMCILRAAVCEAWRYGVVQ